MTIGIDASRAFQKNKTGIEEYSYQVIKNLRNHLRNEQVVLYCNPAVNIAPDFELPENWKIRNLRAPIFWTQIRLSLEILFHPVDVLFVPAHTVPLIHAKNTVVTIHGLEYEFCPKAYSFWQRFYMRLVIKSSCRWAKKIIAVSKNTKKDLTRLYEVPEEKIRVVYEGYDLELKNKNEKLKISESLRDEKYLLFVGRLEERKNICGMIEAFEILKDRHNVPHKLVLAGKFGYGEESIKHKVSDSKHKKDIILPGYITDEEKFDLLKKAEVFLFPTFYEGFGLPILEAQNLGTPVVTSDVSSMPEIAGNGAILVNPKDPADIAEAVYGLISYKVGKNVIIENGYKNAKRFSWEKCAEEIANVIMQIRE